MTRTNNPDEAARYIVAMIRDESTHGTFDGAKSITGFAMLDDYCDASEFLDLALSNDCYSDSAMRKQVVANVNALLSASPIAV